MRPDIVHHHIGPHPHSLIGHTHMLGNQYYFYIFIDKSTKPLQQNNNYNIIPHNIIKSVMFL